MKSCKKLIASFEAQEYQNLLKDIYSDESLSDYQNQRYIQALRSFLSLYAEQEVEIYSAPGRSEIGGNHTDHQNGQVLAAAIHLDAIAIVAKTETEQVKIVSDALTIKTIHLNDLESKKEEEGSCEALVRGVLAKVKASGYRVNGFCAYITSDVLIGAGLSSSATFEILIGTILSGLFNEMQIDPVFLAQAGQFAENVYFGKPCGLMDQMASSVGGIIHIDFKETQNPLIKKLPVDFSLYHHTLCIVDTKGSHADLTSDYRAIPTEMNHIAEYFGKKVLREVPEQTFYQQLHQLRECCGDREILRAVHYFEENKRVEKEVEALNNNNFDDFKYWIKSSGDSSFKFLQNVYTPHDIQHQNISIGLAISEAFLQNRGVCRVHGGGFAGTIQAFVPDDLLSGYKTALESVFGKGTCHPLKIRQYGGKKIL